MEMSVSIVIPVYNSAAFIEETLNSVASQTRQANEVVIVDDGSTDNSYETINLWLSQHPAFPAKLIRQSNQGAASARNTALANATKEYVAFLDSDDLILPNHLKKLLEGMQLCPSCVIVFADQEVFSNEKIIDHSFLHNKPVLNLPHQRIDNFSKIKCSLWATLINGNYIPTSASLVKRQAAIDVGGFDTSLITSEDRHFLLKLSRVGSVGYFNEILARKREHESNLTHSKNNLNVAKNAVNVIRNLLSDKDKYKLTHEELRESKIALDAAINNYLYVASCKSVSAYCRAWLYSMKSPSYKYFFKIKFFLKSILSSVTFY